MRRVGSLANNPHRRLSHEFVNSARYNSHPPVSWPQPIFPLIFYPLNLEGFFFAALIGRGIRTQKLLLTKRTESYHGVTNVKGNKPSTETCGSFPSSTWYLLSTHLLISTRQFELPANAPAGPSPSFTSVGATKALLSRAACLSSIETSKLIHEEKRRKEKGKCLPLDGSAVVGVGPLVSRPFSFPSF